MQVCQLQVKIALMGVAPVCRQAGGVERTAGIWIADKAGTIRS